MANEEKKEDSTAKTAEETTADAPAEKKETEASTATSTEEAAAEVEVPNDEGVEVEVPDKFKKLVEEVESMTVLELHELVKVLEKKFGVSAQAVAVAAPGAGGGDGAAEEQDAFTVELTAVGDQKIAVIKVVKEVLGLGLKEAKDMVDGAPTVLKEGVKKEEAAEMKTKVEEAGGKVTLK